MKSKKNLNLFLWIGVVVLAIGFVWSGGVQQILGEFQPQKLSSTEDLTDVSSCDNFQDCLINPTACPTGYTLTYLWSDPNHVKCIKIPETNTVTTFPIKTWQDSFSYGATIFGDLWACNQPNQYWDRSFYFEGDLEQNADGKYGSVAPSWYYPDDTPSEPGHYSATYRCFEAITFGTDGQPTSSSVQFELIFDPNNGKISSLICNYAKYSCPKDESGNLYWYTNGIKRPFVNGKPSGI